MHGETSMASNDVTTLREMSDVDNKRNVRKNYFTKMFLFNYLFILRKMY